MLEDKNIALYVTGGIAAYKTINLMRTFINAGANVRVAMTESAQEMVTPLTFQILSKNKVHVDTFQEEDPSKVQHIELADWADVSVVSPATANIIAKMAVGIGDDFVSTALLATDTPIFVVPAMNTKMYANEAVQANIELLKKRGIYLMEPDSGFLAEGYEGKGRFPQEERIIEELNEFVIRHEKDLPFSGKNVVVTAGGTIERIDPVRYISNDSSGKMGLAIAEAFYQKGANVTLITSKDLQVTPFIKQIKIENARELYKEVDTLFGETDILVMAAAVSDYYPVTTSDKKMKKQDNLTIEFEKNPDILQSMGEKKTSQLLVGFAAETNDLEEYAKQKLQSKKADIIVANDVSKKDSGFNSDDNEVILFTNDLEPHHIPLSSKVAVAQQLVTFIDQNFNV